MPTGGRIANINWHAAPEPYTTDDGLVEDSRYQIDLLPTFFIVSRHTLPITSIGLAQADKWTLFGEWHTIEISTFDGVFELWMDGQQLFTYTDPDPLPGGGLTIESHHDNQNEEAIMYFDNLTVCELTAPFAPMPTEDPSQ